MVLGSIVLNEASTVPLQVGGNLVVFAILFLVFAVIAAVAGSRGVAGISMDMAKWTVVILFVVAVLSYVVPPV